MDSSHKTILDATEKLAEEVKEQIRNGTIFSINEDKIKLMIKGLGDSRGLIRRVFAEGLGKVGKPTLPHLKKALLNNKNVITRRAAAKTIKLVGDSSSLPYLIEALINDKDTVVQFSAAGAIAIFGEEAAEHLIDVLQNPKSSSMQSGLASWGLGFIGAEAANRIKEAARSKNPKVKSAAIYALEDQIIRCTDKEALKIVTNSLNDQFESVQIEAIKLIGKLHPQKSIIKTLMKKLNSKNPDIRQNSAIALMNLGAVDCIKYLKKCAVKEDLLFVKYALNLAIKNLSKLTS